MSIIKNLKSFKNMSSFNIQSSRNSDIQFLGMYDPNSMKRYRDSRYTKGLGHTHSIYEDIYVGGTWTEHDWGERLIIYDDYYLHNNPCIHLFLRHYPFGDGFLSKRLTSGHWHHIYIVSCNEISIVDHMRVDESKNIFFLGELCEEMPIIDGSEEHYLFVIEGAKSRFRND